MDLYFIIVAIVLGLVMGSFYNVIAYRLSNEESILLPGSYCVHCNHDLRWVDLIPLFSFLMTRGKCRYCNESISFIYPFSELFTAAIFVLCYLVFGLDLAIFIPLVMGSVLVIVVISDFKYLIIPDQVTIVASILVILYKLFDVGIVDTGFAIGYGLIAFLAMWGLKKIGDLIFRQESMGGGDIKLMFLIGLVLGPLGAFISVILASFLAFPMAVMQVIRQNDNVIAFGPFLILAAFILIISGISANEIIDIVFGVS